MANIIDLPDFMFSRVNKDNYSKLGKIYNFIKGLLVGFISKKTNKKVYCKLMNLLFKQGDISYSEGKYCKNLGNSKSIYFPNKRIDRVITNPSEHFEFLFNSYCLENINFNENDTVIDCGANVGELFYSFDYRDIKINYIGFEPDVEAYDCLEKNLEKFDTSLYNVALSDDSKESILYIDTEGANSSLIKFNDNALQLPVISRTLDSFNFEKIKLLKLEAEGLELEVLKGSIKTLKNIEYVSVDYGPERGINSNLTIAEVTNFLYTNSFKIIDGSRYRYIGLFKNNNI